MRNKWTSDKLEQLQTRMLSGWSVKECAADYGIAESTLYTVIQMYCMQTPRNSQHLEHLSVKERFLAGRLSMCGLSLSDCQVQDNCAITGTKLEYHPGSKNTVQPVYVNYLWILVTAEVAKLLEFDSGIIKKCAAYLP